MILKEILLAKLTLHGHGVTAEFVVVSLVLILFAGSFAAISMLTYSNTTTAFAYSSPASFFSSSPSSSPSSASVTTSNSLITNKEEVIQDQVKNFIVNQIVNKSKAAIVVGFVDPNGTRIFSFGNMSTAHNIPVNQNTFFNIGSITKTFTTLLLADMVKQGIVNLADPIEKYLPASVKVPQFNGQKITLADLATHTSGLPEFPPNFLNNNGQINPNYNATLLYQALSNTTLTRAPGSQFQYSSFGMGLLGQILVLRSGGGGDDSSISYEQLVKDRILNVLGMNDTRIALSQDEINNRFPVGHRGGKEITTPTIPTILADAGAFRSTAPDMLKYISANLGLIHTKLDDAIQLQQLIRHPAIIANPMNYTEYAALGWRVLTNFGTEVIAHTGAINGWNANVAFAPTKKMGIVALCNCDPTDADMGNFGFVLLHLTGPENLTGKSEGKIHTSSSG